MGLDEKESVWLSDSHLFGFFKAEQAMPDREKLSSSLGRGLWRYVAEELMEQSIISEFGRACTYFLHLLIEDL